MIPLVSKGGEGLCQ